MSTSRNGELQPIFGPAVRSEIWLAQDTALAVRCRAAGLCAVALPPGDAITKDDIALLNRLDGLVLLSSWAEVHRVWLIERAAHLLNKAIWIGEVPHGTRRERYDTDY